MCEPHKCTSGNTSGNTRVHLATHMQIPHQYRINNNIPSCAHSLLQPPIAEKTCGRITQCNNMSCKHVSTCPITSHPITYHRASCSLSPPLRTTYSNMSPPRAYSIAIPKYCGVKNTWGGVWIMGGFFVPITMDYHQRTIPTSRSCTTCACTSSR